MMTGPAPGTHSRAIASSELGDMSHRPQAAAPLAHAGDDHQQVKTEQQRCEIEPAVEVETEAHRIDDQPPMPVLVYLARDQECGKNAGPSHHRIREWPGGGGEAPQEK